MEIVVFGYPRIPLTRRLGLVATRGEIYQVADLVHTPHVHYVLSTMARGGFSGGPVLNKCWGLMGMVTSSLLENGQHAESGYQAAVSVVPIIECLVSHNSLPKDAEWLSQLYSALPTDGSYTEPVYEPQNAEDLLRLLDEL